MNAALKTIVFEVDMDLTQFAEAALENAYEDYSFAQQFERAGRWRRFLQGQGLAPVHDQDHMTPWEYEKRFSGTRLHGWWRVRVDASRAEAIVTGLRGMAAIKRAFIAPRVRATAPIATGPVADSQDQWRPAPQGVDADWCFAQDGAHGKNTAFADVEFGWLDHVDLPALPAALPAGVVTSQGAHGTNTLGLVLARGNSNGLAPETTIAGLASAGDGFYADISTAMHQATAALLAQGGDRNVLLLELETEDGLPLETVSSLRDRIRDAVSQGIVVIQPAGNRETDLDQALDYDGNPSLRRFDPAFEDSGAIVVGAVEPGGSGKQMANYGSRVDVHGWGASARTTNSTPGFHSAPPITDGYANFGNSSAAAAMVAGVALCLQSSGRALSPQDLRQKLRRYDNGSRRPTAVDIAALPDLRTLVPKSGGAATLRFKQCASTEEQAAFGESCSLFLTTSTGSLAPFSRKNAQWDQVLHQEAGAGTNRIVVRAEAVGNIPNYDVKVAAFPLTTVPDPTTLKDLGPVVLNNPTPPLLAVGELPFTGGAGRWGLVARATTIRDPENPFHNWHWSNFLSATRGCPLMTCVNSHPVRATDAVDVPIGGVGDMQLVLSHEGGFTVDLDGSAWDPKAVVPVQGGDAITLRWSGARGVIRVQQFWQGREVGGVSFRVG